MDLQSSQYIKTCGANAAKMNDAVVIILLSYKKKKKQQHHQGCSDVSFAEQSFIIVILWALHQKRSQIFLHWIDDQKGK